MPGSGLGSSRPFKLVTAASTNLTLVQAGYVEVGALLISGPNAATASWLKMYDAPATSSVTVGSTVPVATFMMPVNLPAHVALPQPLRFMTGLVIAVTAAAADSDVGNAGAGGVVVLGVS